MWLLLNFRGFHIEIQGDLLKHLPRESGFSTYIESAYGKSLEDFIVTPIDEGSRRVIYLNRNGFLFHSILDYLETGQLHFTHDVCSGVVLDELRYWGFNMTHLSICCLDRVLKDQDDAALEEKLAKNWNGVSEVNNVVHPGQGIQEMDKRAVEGNVHGHVQVSDEGQNVQESPVVKSPSVIRDIILNPASCILAKIYCAVVILTIVLSILVLLLETVPSLRRDLPTDSQYTTEAYGDSNNMLINTIPKKWLIFLDLITTAILTVDFIARFLLTTEKFKFICRPITIIDILSILPVWISLIIALYMDISGNTNKIVHIIRYMALLRVLRIFRFSHITLHNKQLRIFSVAISSSWKELVILISILAMYACLFGILAYYIEHVLFEEQYFNSAFEGLYWAVITMTTVGYGDIYLATTCGRVLAVICCIAGIVVIGMTTTILVNTFFTVYQTIEKIERLDAVKQRRSIAQKHIVPIN